MKVIDQLGLRPTKGEVGIEIEVEGDRLVGLDNNFWRTEHDGSLRGESAEFVLKKPVSRDKVVEALTSLSEHLNQHECNVHDSPRAGTHIHINIQQLEVDELMSFLALYMCFEEVLVKWCGAERYGNLFCLTVSQAEGVLDRAIRAARSGRLEHLHTDHLRYSSCNLKAVGQYGSLEFRSMRGTVVIEDIKTWVDMLLALKDYAIGKHPGEILANYSEMGAQDFFNVVLGNYREVLQPDTRDIVVGMRNAQELAFCKNWGQPQEDRYGHPLAGARPLRQRPEPAPAARVDWVAVAREHAQRRARENIVFDEIFDEAGEA